MRASGFGSRQLGSAASLPAIRAARISPVQAMRA